MKRIAILGTRAAELPGELEECDRNVFGHPKFMGFRALPGGAETDTATFSGCSVCDESHFKFEGANTASTP
jgi:hypothetical protein